MVLRISLRVIAHNLQAHCPAASQVDKVALHGEAIAFIHRFGSSLNRHVHFHLCKVDAVFEELPLCDWTTLKPPLVVDRSQPNSELRS
jgi:hypothetical protein